ncbi:ATP-binding protein [Streptomyces lydicus]|uniref:ATP-binding protein n=1 Tax=Streptomyces lydicus TaxID=47763 RepID=UPI003792A1E2
MRAQQTGLRRLPDATGTVLRRVPTGQQRCPDGSSTCPHLRRAAATDEGGRGLFLVAHLAERWGIRYLPRGKVIRAEQALREGEKQPGEDLADIMLEQ